MVNRASDSPTGIVGAVRDARARAEDNARRLGRGTGALRNAQGQAYELDPSSGAPLLVPYADGAAVGSAIKHTPSGVQIRDSADGGPLDFDARAGEFTYLHSSGEIRADGGIRTEAGISSGGDGTIAGVFSAPFRARGANWSSSLYDGAIRWNPNGAIEVVTYDGSAFRGVYASNFAPPPSWAAYKIDRRPVAEFLGAGFGEIVDRLRLDSSWTYDPQAQSFDDGTTEQIGLKLDELPEPLIVRRTDPVSGEDRSSYDVAKILNVALGALQDTRAELAQTRVELAQVRAEVTELRAAPSGG